MCWLEVVYKQCQWVQSEYQYLIPTEWMEKKTPSYNESANEKCNNKINYTETQEKCNLGCKKPCRQTLYSASILGDDYYIKNNKSHVTQIGFSYKNLLKETVKERYQYTLPDLLANLGGAIGLLSGCSCLSIVELVVVMVLFCIQCCQYRRNHPQ